MTIIIPGMNLDHERVDIKPRSVSHCVFISFWFIIIFKVENFGSIYFFFFKLSVFKFVFYLCQSSHHNDTLGTTGQLIKTDICLDTFHWVCYFDFKTTYALISLIKQMCGVYNAFETEGAINDESSYYILNQNGHKKRSAYGLTY